MQNQAGIGLKSLVGLHAVATRPEIPAGTDTLSVQFLHQFVSRHWKVITNLDNNVLPVATFIFVESLECDSRNV